MQDGRAAGAVEIFGRGNGFGPDFASVEVVADEAVGTEVNQEGLVVGDRSGCGGRVEIVGGFDGNFGRGDARAGGRIGCRTRVLRGDWFRER